MLFTFTLCARERKRPSAAPYFAGGKRHTSLRRSEVENLLRHCVLHGLRDCVFERLAFNHETFQKLQLIACQSG